MRAIALVLALVCFCTTWASIIATFGDLMRFDQGLVLTIIGAMLTCFWVAVSADH